MTRLVAQNCISILSADLALILMVNPRTRDTVKTIMREGYFVENNKYRPVQNQISGWIMKNNAPLLSKDVQTDITMMQEPGFIVRQYNNAGHKVLKFPNFLKVVYHQDDKPETSWLSLNKQYAIFDANGRFIAPFDPVPCTAPGQTRAFHKSYRVIISHDQSIHCPEQIIVLHNKNK